MKDKGAMRINGTDGMIRYPERILSLYDTGGAISLLAFNVFMRIICTTYFNHGFSFFFFLFVCLFLACFSFLCIHVF